MVVTAVQFDVVYSSLHVYCSTLVTSVCILDERAAQQVKYVHGGSTSTWYAFAARIVWAYSLATEQSRGYVYILYYLVSKVHY